jgi:hypothetical protein
MNPTRTVPPPPAGAPPRRRRPRWWWAVLIGFLAGAVTATLLTTLRPDPDDPPPTAAEPTPQDEPEAQTPEDEPDGDDAPPEQPPEAPSTAPTGTAVAGIWRAPEELAALPTDGQAWERLVDVADRSLTRDTDLADRDEHNVRTLAAALVAAREDDGERRADVVDALEHVMAAEPDDDDLLAACRRLTSYVAAADVIGLSEVDPDVDAEFRDWLREMLALEYDGGGGGGTIVEVHERRANNWGTHAGASRIAAARYLGDDEELAAAAAVFRGWLGERDSYTGFEFGDLDWQADAQQPVPVNPIDATIEGHSVDGVLPDDQRRGGDFEWPPPQENYVWEALQGAVVQAELLERAGYEAWEWGDRALLRAIRWLYDEADYPAEGDDRWLPYLIDRAYDTSFADGDTEPGKAMGFAEWTHAETISGG